jgi:hypothetical protein
VPRELAALFGAPALREIAALSARSFVRLLCRTACALVCAQPSADTVCYDFYDDLTAMRQGADADAALRAKLLAASSAGVRRLLTALHTKLRSRGVYDVASDSPRRRALHARPAWLQSAAACDELLAYAENTYPASLDAEEGFIERMRCLGEVEYVRPVMAVDALLEAGAAAVRPGGVGANSTASVAHGVITREAIERDMDHREHWCGVQSTAFLLAGEALAMVAQVVGVEIDQHVATCARNGVSTFRHGSVKSGALERNRLRAGRHRRGRVPDGAVVLNESALDQQHASEWRRQCLYNPDAVPSSGEDVRYSTRARVAKAARATNIFARATSGCWGSGHHRVRLRTSIGHARRSLKSARADSLRRMRTSIGRAPQVSPAAQEDAAHIAAVPNPFYDRCQLLLRASSAARGSASRSLSPAQRVQIVDEVCGYWERTLALVPLSHSGGASSARRTSGSGAATDPGANVARGPSLGVGVGSDGVGSGQKRIDLDAIAQGAAGAELLERVGSDAVAQERLRLRRGARALVNALVRGGKAKVLTIFTAEVRHIMDGGSEGASGDRVDTTAAQPLNAGAPTSTSDTAGRHRDRAGAAAEGFNSTQASLPFAWIADIFAETNAALQRYAGSAATALTPALDSLPQSEVSVWDDFLIDMWRGTPQRLAGAFRAASVACFSASAAAILVGCAEPFVVFVGGSAMQRSKHLSTDTRYNCVVTKLYPLRAACDVAFADASGAPIMSDVRRGVPLNRIDIPLHIGRAAAPALYLLGRTLVNAEKRRKCCELDALERTRSRTAKDLATTARRTSAIRTMAAMRAGASTTAATGAYEWWEEAQLSTRTRELFELPCRLMPPLAITLPGAFVGAGGGKRSVHWAADAEVTLRTAIDLNSVTGADHDGGAQSNEVRVAERLVSEAGGALGIACAATRSAEAIAYVTLADLYALAPAAPAEVAGNRSDDDHEAAHGAQLRANERAAVRAALELCPDSAFVRERMLRFLLTAAAEAEAATERKYHDRSYAFFCAHWLEEALVESGIEPPHSAKRRRSVLHFFCLRSSSILLFTLYSFVYISTHAQLWTPTTVRASKTRARR